MVHASTATRTNLFTNTGDGSYERYFYELNRMLSATANWSDSWQQYAFDTGHLRPYLERLTEMISCIHRRYRFEADDPLMIDRSASGFPSSYTMTRLGVDRKQGVGARLSAAAARDLFVDQLFKTGTVSTVLQNEIAKAEYHEALVAMSVPFDSRFDLIAFERLDDHADTSKYRIVWGTFNQTRNVPCVHSMVFTYDGDKVIEKQRSREFKELSKVLAFESQSYASVGLMAQHIDEALPDVSLEVFSRVTLGPVHVPGITDQDDVWTPVLEKHGTDDDFVFEMIVDHLYVRETKRPGLLAGLGIVTARPQKVFAINRGDPVCNERGASEVEQFACLTHALARTIDGGTDVLPAEIRARTRLITYTKEGEML